MEQTIGKRIAACRRSLGLTQDQLAEKLGVTAQAVSKWENDQSCPDISMLPRLAEIFGVTTDELLGRESGREDRVYEAEVVGQGDCEAEDSKGRWEFRWENGRWGTLSMAVFVLLVGGLLLAANLLRWEVTFWDVLWPCGMLVFGLFALIRRFTFLHLGFTLFGGYFLLSNLHIMPFAMGWKLALPVCLVLFGVSLLVDAFRRPKRGKVHFVHKGPAGPKGAPNTECNIDGDRFDCNVAFGDKNFTIDMEELAQGSVSLSFGDCDLDLSGVQSVAADCSIDANCSFGDLTILVPRRFLVKPTTSTAFANVELSGHPDPNPEGTISLEANCSFGEISIRYV